MSDFFGKKGITSSWNRESNKTGWVGFRIEQGLLGYGIFWREIKWILDI